MKKGQYFIFFHNFLCCAIISHFVTNLEKCHKFRNFRGVQPDGYNITLGVTLLLSFFISAVDFAKALGFWVSLAMVNCYQCTY